MTRDATQPIREIPPAVALTTAPTQRIAHFGLAAFAVSTLVAGCGRSDPGAVATEQWAMLDRYCVECHNDAEYTGDVSFESLGPDDIAAHAATFEKVVRKLRGQLMPPPGEPRPDADVRYSFISWLESSLDAVERSRARGVPIVGYTWWPLFALVAWAYRQGRRPLASHLLQMGLYDLEPESLARIRTPLVDLYRELAAGGSRVAGRLAGG